MLAYSFEKDKNCQEVQAAPGLRPRFIDKCILNLNFYVNQNLYL